MSSKRCIKNVVILTCISEQTIRRLSLYISVETVFLKCIALQNHASKILIFIEASMEGIMLADCLSQNQGKFVTIRPFLFKLCCQSSVRVIKNLKQARLKG